MKRFFLKTILILLVKVSLAQVNADFNVNKTSGCAPFLVNFLDISTGGANNWLWDFGNGITSNSQNPTYVYSKPGFYTVTLTASNNNSFDIEVKSALIRVNAPPIPNFSTQINKGCTPHTTQFTDLSIPQSGTITNWYWAFGNGFNSTNQNPTSTFTEIKKYNIYLKVTDINGCTATLTKNSFIELDGPKADFEFDSVICGLPANVLFLNQSQGNNLDYFWDFGDGNTSTSEIPGVYSYTAFDSTVVMLAVTEKATGCSDTIRQNLIVGNYEATFDYNIICGTNDFTIEVDNTTPFYAAIEWDFNGEAFKFTDKTSYHFSSPGEKTITLKTTIDATCIDTTVLKYTLPTPSFSYSAPICSDPFQVTFENKSKGDGLTYLWDFKDSTFSTDINPYHEFSVPPESYLVKLYAKDKFGCIDSFHSYVKVPFPIARFYEKDSIYTGCTPLNLTFLDTSYTLSSKISSVHWDFGDPSSGSSNTSNSLSPTHTYNSPGNYDITYIIYTNDGCADTAIYSSVIKAGEKPTYADFDQLINDTICYGNSINFIENISYTTNSIQSNYFCWSFYGDTSAILIDPEKSPANCPKSIQNFTSNNDYVNYSNPIHKYIDFKTSSNTIGDTLFTGNVESKAGLLYTHLVTGYNNCFTEVIKSNFIDTTIAIIGIAVQDSLKTFSDSTQTFGFFNASLNYDSVAFAYGKDAAITDTLFKILDDTNYVKLQEGHKYNVYTKVVNKVSSCENYIWDEIVIDSSRIKFDITNSQCLSNNPVLFDDNSYSKFGTIERRTWLVDGNIVANNKYEDSSYYNFPDTGIYTVSLEIEYKIVSRQNGIKKLNYYTKTTSKKIKIEGIKANGFSDTLKICGGDTIFFSDSSKSTNLVKEYVWKFGYNTDSSIVKNPFYIYKEPGMYIPSLFAIDVLGCFDSINLMAIEVNKPIIDFDISDSLVCKNDVVAFKNKSQGNNLSFKWEIDTSKQYSIDIVHQFNYTNEFDVKLYAIDLFGCEDSIIKTKTIKVEEFPETKFSGDKLYINCPPLSSSFKDTSITPVLKWNWDFGDGSTSNTQNPSHVFTTPGLYNIQLITTNYAGCSDTLKKIDYIEVDGPSGNVNFKPDSICTPEEIIFNHQFKNTNYFIWDYGDGNSISYNYNDNQDSTSYTYKKGGNFQPSIELIGGANCLYTLPQLPMITADSISANFETTDSVICDIFNIPFTNTSRSNLNSSFIWDFGNGDTSTQKSPIFSYLTDSFYDVKLTQTSPLGCKDSITKSIRVFNAPFPDLHINNSNYCIPSLSDIKIKFNNINFVYDSVYFLIDNVFFFGDSITSNITTEGNHDIKYIIKYGSGACVVDSLIKKTFYKWPIADFNYSPSNNSMDEPVIFFNNNSLNSDSWLWNFDDLNQSNLQSLGHNFNNQGIYNVSLIAKNIGGCSDTIIKEVSIAPYNFVSLPSAFSPNGDGKNETFGILRAGELDIQEFKIFNRWGNVVFKTNDKNKRWDGKRKGKLQDVGTYIYFIKYVTQKGEIKEIKGNFSLLR